MADGAAGRALAAAAFLLTVGLILTASAQDGPPGQAGSMLSPGRSFAEASGESLYVNICQGCHMHDGRGAIGAGAYPPLADDPNLADAGYAVHVVVRGLRAMPPIGRAMTDPQVAEVVNYVRNHFGNHDEGAVSADDVKAARP